jgi:DNA-binding NarL/FixJ family response regulator
MEVQKHIDMRGSYPEPSSGNLTDRQIQIIKLIANGFTGEEIADVLYISERTVDTMKTQIYTALNVRNENEVIRVALYLELINPEELIFFGGNYLLNPRPPKQQTKRRAKC